jgi:hypothetical protein
MNFADSPTIWMKKPSVGIDHGKTTRQIELLSG